MSALNEAIAAIKEGRRAEGREMLGKILLVEPNNVTALFWMTEVADTIDERRRYLKHILAIDLNNALARKALEMLGPIQEPVITQRQTLSVQESAPQQRTSVVTESTTAEVADDTKKCPFCAETIKAEAIICRFCGRDLVPHESGPTSGTTLQEHINQEATQLRKDDVQNLAWICPNCSSRILTPIVLRTVVSLQCPRCSRIYGCFNGEVIWGRYTIDRAVWSVWVDWIVRLQQADGSFVETGFTLQTLDFTVANGDFLVVLSVPAGRDRVKVVYVENKSSGNIIMPKK